MGGYIRIIWRIIIVFVIVVYCNFYILSNMYLIALSLDKHLYTYFKTRFLFKFLKETIDLRFWEWFYQWHYKWFYIWLIIFFIFLLFIIITWFGVAIMNIYLTFGSLFYYWFMVSGRIFYKNAFDYSYITRHLNRIMNRYRRYKINAIHGRRRFKLNEYITDWIELKYDSGMYDYSIYWLIISILNFWLFSRFLDNVYLTDLIILKYRNKFK